MKSLRLWLLGRRKKTPEEKERMMDSLKIARLKIMERVYQNLPEQLRNRDDIARAIAEQINYAELERWLPDTAPRKILLRHSRRASSRRRGA